MLRTRERPHKRVYGPAGSWKARSLVTDWADAEDRVEHTTPCDGLLIKVPGGPVWTYCNEPQAAFPHMQQVVDRAPQLALEPWRIPTTDIVHYLMWIWARESHLTSNLGRAAEHWAFRALVEIGRQEADSVVPVVVGKLREKPSPYWLMVIGAIADEDVAIGESTVAGAASKWIEWARGMGYVGGPTATAGRLRESEE